MNRYLPAIQAIAAGNDTITGVAEALGMLRPTVETHFRWLREHRLVSGTRGAANVCATYVLTPAGRKWIEAQLAAADVLEEAEDAPASGKPIAVGWPDETVTADLYRWLRLSPPVPHTVAGRLHRLSHE
jgi:hypothetical protein